MSDDKKAADVEDHFGFLCDVGHSPRLGGSRLGIPIRTESPVPGLIAFLKHKQMLIVLDSCEHVRCRCPIGGASAQRCTRCAHSSDQPIVSEICRKLDGIALAIELAASLVDTLDVRGVADRLDDRFRLLTRGRRTALPRHQTLSATLDWSYELLPPALRVILRRLSVFAGWFTSESASAVAGGEAFAASDVIDCIAMI
jgi:predicted ATPase